MQMEGQPPYDFALVFGAEAQARKIDLAKEVLAHNDFQYHYFEEKVWDLKLKETVTSRKLLFIKIENYKVLLKEAENLRIEKIKYNDLPPIVDESREELRINKTKEEEEKHIQKLNEKHRLQRQPKYLLYLKATEHLKLPDYPVEYRAIVEKLEKYKRFKYQYRSQFLDIVKEEFKVPQRKVNNSNFLMVPQSGYKRIVSADSVNSSQQYLNLRDSQAQLEDDAAIAAAFSHVNVPEDKEIFDKLFTPAEQLLIKYSYLVNILIIVEDKQQNFIDIFEIKYNLVQTVMLHKDEEKPNSTLVMEADADQIKNYYGENISFYFEFIQYMQKWLLACIVAGVGVEVVNIVLGVSVRTSQFELIFSIFMQVWASAFYVSWRRKEKQISILNRSYGHDYGLQFKQSEIANLELKTDPVTGLEVKTYSSVWRKLLYIRSFIITIPLILATLLFIVISLNVRGHTDRTHALHIYTLYKLSMPGAIFDRKKIYLSIIPDIIHVLVVAFLNQMHYVYALKITKWELHDKFDSYEASIIWKRILFQIFSTFTVLFYIAFIKFDILALRTELIILYSIDEVRRLLLEAYLPYLAKKSRIEFLEKKRRKSYMQKIGENQAELDQKQRDEQNNEYVQEKLLEIGLPQYQVSDDLIEVVINFGYLTLFAPAYNLAPLLFYVFHYLEIKGDKYKLCNTHQRPIPFKCSGLGPWNTLLNVMSILCVITNVILFSFSSDQIKSLIPTLFQQIEKAILTKGSLVTQTQAPLVSQLPGIEQGREQVFIALVIEHFMLGIIWYVRSFLKSKEDWTNIYLARSEYKKTIR